MFDLKYQTPARWTETVLADFDAFLVDHAAAERKASATGLSFVVRYPDRVALIEPMIALAREELEHFHRVYKVCEARGLRLGADEKDEYVRGILQAVRTGRDDRLLDRLVTASVIEARGFERFGLVAEALPAGELKEMYVDIARSEARHRGLFLRLARNYFTEDEITARLEAFLDVEANVIAALPLRAALH